MECSSQFLRVDWVNWFSIGYFSENQAFLSAQVKKVWLLCGHLKETAPSCNILEYKENIMLLNI